MLLLANVVHAQVGIPGGAQPGQIEQPFVRPPAPRPAPPVNIPERSRTAPPESARAVVFQVTDIDVQGAASISAANINAITRPLVGRDISLADLYEAADRIEVLYRNQGYILTRVLVPEQRISDGRVRLQVVEGFVQNVVIRGTLPAGSRLLAQYGEKIKASRPLRAEVLERYLLLMNDLPGSSAQATVRAVPGSTGAAELIVDVTSRAVDANAEVNNRGSRALGPLRLEANLALHNLAGQYHDLQLNLATTPNDELRVASLAYERPVGSEGLLLGMTLTGAQARPEIPGVDVETSSYSGQLRASYPVLRSRAQNLYLRGTLGWLNGRTEVDSLPLTRDKTRALRLGASYDLADRWVGVNTVDLEFSQGLDAAGATQAGAAESSRQSASPDFRKLTLYLARLQSLAPRMELLAALSGQYATGSLFPSEQFAFGGGTVGRAYDSAELLGDSGAALKIELRYAGQLQSQVLSAYTVYGFYEIGKVFRRAAGTEPRSDSGADIGLGLRFNLLRSLSGYVEVAKPLTRDVSLERDRDMRVFAALRWTL